MYTSVKLTRYDLHEIIKAAIEKETGKRVVDINVKLGICWSTTGPGKEMFLDFVEIDLEDRKPRTIPPELDPPSLR